jgi:Mn2+/Fe2+ NRAMP family transporter
LIFRPFDSWTLGLFDPLTLRLFFHYYSLILNPIITFFKTAMNQSTSLGTFVKTFGPGMLMAGAAIGVSHLVQSTRAGADYGFSLWWVLLLACATKYPFLEFGSRYAAATGETMLAGYLKMGKSYFFTFGALTLGTMFIILASVTWVTAGLAEQFFSLGLSTRLWSIILLVICILLVLIGRFPAIDKSMKLIVVLLSVLTLFAVGITLGTDAPAKALAVTPPSYLTASGLAFIIAFMGWMPIPLDSAVWQSIWARERFKQTNHQPSVRHALLDFNIGYLFAVVIGILFFLLGAFVMFGHGNTFPAGSVAFSSALVDMYGHTLGAWSRPIISVAAFIAMFSTTLAVVDIYPRVMKEMVSTYANRKGHSVEPDWWMRNADRLFLVITPVFAVIILFYFTGAFTRLIDFAAALSFLSAPVLAWFNLKLVSGKFTPQHARPGSLYVVLCVASIVFLLAFSGLFVWVSYL